MDSLTINKQEATVHPGVSERLAAKKEDRPVTRRWVLLLLMSFASVLAALTVRFPRVGSFWHYFWLTTCLVFSVLTLVEVLRGGLFHFRP